MNDTNKEKPLTGEFSWRWAATVTVVLLLTFLACVELLRALFPLPHPRSFRSDAYLRLSDATRAIVVGSSHVAFGFDPRPYGDALVTLPAGAMDYACAEPVIRRALERAPNIRLVILEADINGLLIDAVERGRGDYYQLYALGLTTDDLPRGRYWKWRQAALESRLLYPIFFLRRLTPRSLLWEGGLELAQQREAGDAMLKGYVPSEDVISERNDGRVVIEFHKAEFRRDHSRMNLAALQRIADEMRARGIALVLMRFPKHRTYRENRPPEWERKYEAMMAQLKAYAPEGSYAVWDFDAMALPDEQFMDGHHLNRFGAARLDAVVRPRVEALLAGPP